MKGLYPDYKTQKMVESKSPIKNIKLEINKPNNPAIKIKKVTIKNFFDQCLEILVGKKGSNENSIINNQRN